MSKRNAGGKGRRYRDEEALFNLGGIVTMVMVALLVVGLVVLFATGVFKLPGAKTPAASQVSSSQPESTGSQEISSQETSSMDYSSRITDPSLSYQLLYPELYVDEPEFTPPHSGDKVIYLTFNDAPSSNTDALLQVLSRMNVKATFFVTVANMGESDCQAMLRKISDAGHTIGVYTYSGDFDVMYDSVEDYLADFKKCDDMIFAATGKHATVFRFPGGSGENLYNNGLGEELADEMTRRGYVYHDWNVDGSVADAASSLAQQVINACVANEKNVVLMSNDGGNSSLGTAVQMVIEELSDRGYRFAALDPTVKPFRFY